jgi:hypothetical protein
MWPAPATRDTPSSSAAETLEDAAAKTPPNSEPEKRVLQQLSLIKSLEQLPADWEKEGAATGQRVL